MGATLSNILNLRHFSWPNWQASDVTDENMELKRKQLEQAILDAVDAGNVDSLQQLSDDAHFTFWGIIEALNSKNPLLHRASKKGHVNVVQFLLNYGMDVDDVDSSGMTALHVACQKRHNSCVPLFLERCRDMDKRDVWGRTALIKALVFRNFEAAKMLLAKGANPNASDIYGMTPLSTAIDYNLMDMLHWLVRHGADVNLITQHPCRISGPPLYLAINNKNLSMVKELLKLGANTQPRVQDYSYNCGSGRWQYLSFHTFSPSSSAPNLQHSNAVALAISSLLKRGEENPVVSSVCMEILMAVLAAHGYSLGPAPDVLIRVLFNSRPQNYAMLLHKLQVCSSCSSEEIMALIQDSTVRPVNLQQLNQRSRKPPRRVSSLQNQARRVARQALMASSHNVVWACNLLECPPALKSLMLLKDIDRAFNPSHGFGFEKLNSVP